MTASHSERDGRFPWVRNRVGYGLVATLLVAALVVVAVRSGFLAIPDGTTETAQSLLERYGLPALFGVFIIEGAMLLYFAPSESLVPAAVLGLADSTTDIAVILAVAVVGATIGQTALFVLAKRGGREAIHERRWLNVGRERLDRFESWFDRWGPIVVPVSNTLLFTRGMATIPAGLAEMNTRTFVVLSALGTLSFELLLAGLTLGVVGLL
ncbi:DedA family protein [Salinibaculum rarum]|uniref:DedA family protein n=1 Tax=Salinibaculum rarum TaxID=3058903 RepID=UPI00265D7958|nr:VTT domain-containing protein [Salinibaculum sp. KK48]